MWRSPELFGIGRLQNVSRRKLTVDVAGAYLLDLETPVAEVPDSSMTRRGGREPRTVPLRQECDRPVCGVSRPFAEALVKLADDQLAFTMAESGLGGENMYRRMAAVENGILELRHMMRL